MGRTADKGRTGMKGGDESVRERLKGGDKGRYGIWVGSKRIPACHLTAVFNACSVADC